MSKNVATLKSGSEVTQVFR